MPFRPRHIGKLTVRLIGPGNIMLYVAILAVITIGYTKLHSQNEKLAIQDKKLAAQDNRSTREREVITRVFCNAHNQSQAINRGIVTGSRQPKFDPLYRQFGVPIPTPAQQRKIAAKIKDLDCDRLVMRVEDATNNEKLLKLLRHPPTKSPLRTSKK